ncbi:MAG: cobalamin-dependent protein [Candidatus Bathyarchaeia archaeon]
MSVQNEAVKNLKDAFYAQDDTKCPELTKKALEVGIDPLDLLENYLLEWAKEITGRSLYDTEHAEEGKPKLRSENAVMLSDLVMIAEVLTACVEVLKPELAKNVSQSSKASGKVIIGTVEGDVHDIGKSLVASMLASAGFMVKDVGYDVPAKVFVNEAKTYGVDILALSCSLSMAKLTTRDVVNNLKKVGIRDNLKIIIGGQAHYESDCEVLGVDAFGASISAALTKSNELMRILREKRAKN